MLAPQPSRGSCLLLSVALVSGVLVYDFFVVVPNGYLAAIALPSEYFLWFGKPKRELALAVIQYGTALPVAMLVSGAVLAVCRVLENRSVPFLVSILVGMLLCYMYWNVSFLLLVPAGLPPGVKPYPATAIIRSLLFPPWWALPTVVAPWLGVAFAAWLLRRRGEA